MHSVSSLRTLSLVLLTCISGFAQTAREPFKIGSVKVQGAIRSRVETWDWFRGTAGDGSYTYSGSLLRLSFSQQEQLYDWQIDLGAPILLGLPSNATAPGAQGLLGVGGNYFVANDGSRNAAMVFPKQAFVRFKSLFGDKAQSLRAGRFEFNDGTEVAPANETLAAVKRNRAGQRLIGTFGWVHVGRSFDGAHYVYSTPTANLTVIGAIPTRGVFQVDGWGWVDAGFVYAALTRPVIGKRNNGEWRLLGLYYHDWRRVLKADNRPAALRSNDFSSVRIGNFGGHYLHTTDTSSGPVDLMFWGMLQTGQWGQIDHRAGSVAIEGGWQPNILPSLKPWIRAGYFYGSGDKDPLDGTHNTFFQILPTPRPFARFPFFNLMNNEDFLGMVTLRPHPSVDIHSEFHALRLAQRNDLWYLGGGAFQPWTFGYSARPVGGNRSLANLYDASVDYKLNLHVTLSWYLGYAQGKAAPAGIYSRDKNSLLNYFEVNYRF
jgi:hypothetical protein